MTHIEKMKQWLEALEVVNSCIDDYYLPKEKAWLPEIEQAITDLRQAIAETEKEAEKVEYAYTCVGCDYLSWANNFSCECQSPPLMKFKQVKVIR